MVFSLKDCFNKNILSYIYKFINFLLFILLTFFPLFLILHLIELNSMFKFFKNNFVEILKAQSPKKVFF